MYLQRSGLAFINILSYIHNIEHPLKIEAGAAIVWKVVVIHMFGELPQAEHILDSMVVTQCPPVRRALEHPHSWIISCEVAGR